MEGSLEKEKLQSLTLLLQAAFDAESQVLLKLNVSATNLDAVRDLLPSYMPLPLIHLPKMVGMPLKLLSMNPLFEK